MAQEDYFFALAQMLLQGQSDSFDAKLKINEKEEEKRRYDEGKPLRDATLESVLSNTATNKAQAERIGVETEGARQQNKFAVEDRPFDIEKRQESLAFAKAQRKRADFEASDENLAAQTKKQNLDLEAAELLNRARKAEVEDATDPELRAARKGEALDKRALAGANLSEFMAGSQRREKSAQLEYDAKEAAHLARLTPEQQKRVNDATVTAAEMELVARRANIDTSRVQTAASMLEVLQRSKVVTDRNRKELSGAVSKLLEGKAQVAMMSRDPNAGEAFVRESAKLVALTASLEQQDPEEAAYQAQVLMQVRRLLDQQVEAGEISPEDWSRQWIGAIKDKNRDLKLLVAGDGLASSSDALGGMFTPPDASRRPEEPSTAQSELTRGQPAYVEMSQGAEPAATTEQKKAKPDPLDEMFKGIERGKDDRFAAEAKRDSYREFNALDKDAKTLLREKLRGSDRAKKVSDNDMLAWLAREIYRLKQQGVHPADFASRIDALING